MIIKICVVILTLLWISNFPVEIFKGEEYELNPVFMYTTTAFFLYGFIKAHSLLFI